MDLAFLIVIGVTLCLLSGMIAARMAAGGAPARQTALTVAELWIVFVLWIAVVKSVSAAAGSPVSGGGAGELRDMGSRLAALDSSARLWAIAGVVASAAIVGHLMWSLRRTLCQTPWR